MFSELTNAYTSLSVRKLWRGDSAEAQKKLRKLLCPTWSCRKVNAANKSNDIQKHILRLCPVHVFGTDCLTLLDTGAGPNRISSSLLTFLGVKPKPTRRTITVTSGVNAKCTRLIQDTPVTFPYGRTQL